MGLNQVKAIDTDDYKGTRLFVLGDEYYAGLLVKRLMDGIESDPDENINDYKLSYGPRLPFIKIDTLFIISDEITQREAEEKYSGVFVKCLTRHEASCGYGFVDWFNDAQVALKDTDWRAIRDMERQFLAMHDAGVWTLPDDVRLAMIEREALRADL